MAGLDGTLNDSLPARLQADAQAEAERFYGDLPSSTWLSGGDEAEPSPRWQRIAWKVLTACALAAAAVAVFSFSGASDKVPQQPVREAFTASSDDTYSASLATGDPADDIIDDAPPTLTPGNPQLAPTPTPASPDASLDISKRGNEWRIDAYGASRLLTAQRLAEATGSRLLGNVDQLSVTRPLDLTWKGRQAASAWEAVLGSELSFATQCNSSRCLVWILEAGATTAEAPARPMRPVMAQQADSISAMATAVVPNREAVLPSDSPDPRIAAHHD